MCRIVMAYIDSVLGMIDWIAADGRFKSRTVSFFLFVF